MLKPEETVNGETLQEKRTQAGTGTATHGVEDQETLETRAVIGELSDPVQAQIHDLLPDGVVTTREVVGGVLLAADQLLRVEQLPVRAGSDFVDNGRLQIHEDGAWDVFPGAGLAEERVEGVISSANGLVTRHLSIRLNTGK
ncbi:hypothetical protein CR513_31025, partial [Mucuna pruriens]